MRARSVFPFLAFVLALGACDAPAPGTGASSRGGTDPAIAILNQWDTVDPPNYAQYAHISGPPGFQIEAAKIQWQLTRSLYQLSVAEIERACNPASDGYDSSSCAEAKTQAQQYLQDMQAYEQDIERVGAPILGAQQRRLAELRNRQAAQLAQFLGALASAYSQAASPSGPHDTSGFATGPIDEDWCGTGAAAPPGATVSC